MAHVTNSVATEHPSKHRRNTPVTALRLYDHWNMMIYCSKCSLLTPRNGRRKFAAPSSSLHGVAVHLADPVTVVVPHVLPLVMVDRREVAAWFVP